jgi:hypothetical protein
MNAAQLIAKLQRLDPETPIAYPREDGDHPVEVLATTDGYALLSTESELIGSGPGSG